ncbi:hypothetical protein GPALN_006608 [Globodera pallida]|nr:hypothetical protein GPALN_006608 [Globodera pallida]
MVGRCIRNFLNVQHIICKVQQLQTVRVKFLHQSAKNVCPAAVISCGARMASSSSNRPSHRSKLLDAYHNNGGSKLLVDFHNKRTPNLQLAALGEHVVAFALDSQGSRQIYYHSVVSAVHRAKVETCQSAEKAQLVDALRGHVVILALHKSGTHVIRKALELIINEITAEVIPLSLDKYGSRVIERVLEHCTHKRLVLEQLHANVLILVMDKYGSYVIRHVIEHGLPEDRERIVRSLQGDIMKYAQDKFGCLVILKCLIGGTADQKKALFDNVCVGGPKTLRNARQLMADEFGSFVIEKFFECGTDDQKAQLVDALRGHVLTLALQMYGGPVIQAALKSILEELTPRSCVIKCIKDHYGSYVLNMVIKYGAGENGAERKRSHYTP